jgi:glycine C-acetyltransferase
MNSILIKRFTTKAGVKLTNICKTLIQDIKQAGTYKQEKKIESPQGVEIMVNGKRMLNFCANNYLGLSNNKELIEESKKAMDARGYGMSSVRFICGTQDLHKKLENTISKFHQKEDAILYTSCFDANTGFFEAVLNESDAIISDTLNHASIIDGIRLCKSKRLRYKHLDLNDLEEQLKQAEGSRIKLIVTDGVFSMDGDIAPLDKIVNIAQKYEANIFVDESHASGFIGKTGRGTPELFEVTDQIDIINSTLGKALGGGSGGYTTSSKEIIDLLRQKSRPYLFSNSLVPAIVASSLKVFDILSNSSKLITQLNENTKLFRTEMKKLGFTILGSNECPIVPVLLKEERLASEFGEEMIKNGIYVVGFSFPVVPKGQARIRVQLSAAHTREHVLEAVRTFEKIGKAKNLI